MEIVMTRGRKAGSRNGSIAGAARKIAQLAQAMVEAREEADRRVELVQRVFWLRYERRMSLAAICAELRERGDILTHRQLRSILGGERGVVGRVR
jgi:hypothetical protein